MQRQKERGERECVFVRERDRLPARHCNHHVSPVVVGIGVVVVGRLHVEVEAVQVVVVVVDVVVYIDNNRHNADHKVHKIERVRTA